MKELKKIKLTKKHVVDLLNEKELKNLLGGSGGYTARLSYTNHRNTCNLTSGCNC